MAARATNRLQRCGFTLIEMMVGLAVASLVIMAAVAFARDEIKAMGRGNQSLEMLQTGRAALDLLTRDLINSGAAIGYTMGGEFVGLHTDRATVIDLGPNSSASAVPFQADNAPGVDPVWGYGVVSDDILIRGTDFSTSTIVAGPPLQVDFRACNPTLLKPNALIVLRDKVGTTAGVWEVTSFGPGNTAPCPECLQSGLCDTFTPTALANPKLGFGTAALNAFAAESTVTSGYHTTLWFMTYGVDGSPQLRRAVDTDCARGPACGDLIADNIETVQAAYFRFDSEAIPPDWVQVTGPINSRDRLRVDLELVVRSRTPDERFHAPIQLALEGAGGGTFPPTNPTLTTTQRESLKFYRIALRSSTYLRNSGPGID
ncbi:MAG: prepilin-type N-terminal cleavage/methylation domain-containing protein [Deltaproteobacteria bacterium]|nr:prepilin-type N-terminal cleavage/methylation domain-containing protein [Deltaproteobacteria bacterium]